jgi:hypothetical protein
MDLSSFGPGDYCLEQGPSPSAISPDASVLAVTDELSGLPSGDSRPPSTGDWFPELALLSAFRQHSRCQPSAMGLWRLPNRLRLPAGTPPSPMKRSSLPRTTSRSIPGLIRSILPARLLWLTRRSRSKRLYQGSRYSRTQLSRRKGYGLSWRKSKTWTFVRTQPAKLKLKPYWLLSLTCCEIRRNSWRGHLLHATQPGQPFWKNPTASPPKPSSVGSKVGLSRCL